MYLLDSYHLERGQSETKNGCRYLGNKFNSVSFQLFRTRFHYYSTAHNSKHYNFHYDDHNHNNSKDNNNNSTVLLRMLAQ